MILRLFRRVMPGRPDLEQGDSVICPGDKGVGFIRDIAGDFARVTRGNGLYDIMPLSLLRRTNPCGHQYDGRRK